MIIEVAELRIRPGSQAEFESAIVHGVTSVISKSKGFLGYRILRGIESPARYLLEITWDSVEDHTVGFRQSPAMAEWRAIVGPFFAEPPAVEHFDIARQEPL